MAFPIRVPARHAASFALLAACAAASACSNKTPPTPDAFVAATVGVGAQSSPMMCGFGSRATFVALGTPTGPKPTTVRDGDQGASVSCTVSAVGSGFDIDLNVTSSGLQGGSLTVTSPSGMGAVTTQGGMGIRASFTSGQSGEFSESDCTIAFTYNGTTVPDSPPIAAGRIWGHISCPKAKEQSGQQMGSQPSQCDGEADFLFEQCGQ
jgi:hypothetical protein